MERYAFAKSIGCEVNEDNKYPLTQSGFLRKLGDWTKSVEREVAKRMNDPRAGREV